MTLFNCEIFDSVSRKYVRLRRRTNINSFARTQKSRQSSLVIHYCPYCVFLFTITLFHCCFCIACWKLDRQRLASVNILVLMFMPSVWAREVLFGVTDRKTPRLCITLGYITLHYRYSVSILRLTWIASVKKIQKIEEITNKQLKPTNGRITAWFTSGKPSRVDSYQHLKPSQMVRLAIYCQYL